MFDIVVVVAGAAHVCDTVRHKLIRVKKKKIKPHLRLLLFDNKQQGFIEMSSAVDHVI